MREGSCAHNFLTKFQGLYILLGPVLNSSWTTPKVSGVLWVHSFDSLVNLQALQRVWGTEVLQFDADGVGEAAPRLWGSLRSLGWALLGLGGLPFHAVGLGMAIQVPHTHPLTRHPSPHPNSSSFAPSCALLPPPSPSPSPPHAPTVCLAVR